MPNNYTPEDHRWAHAMRVGLDERESHEAAVGRLYNTLATAYQRLDAECAGVHQENRTLHEELDASKDRCAGWRLVWLVTLLFALLSFAKWKGWL